MTSRLNKALNKAWQRSESQSWTYGLMGKIKGGVPVFDVVGRAGYVYVRIRNQNGAQTSPPARNDPGVAHSENLPVRMRMEGTTLVIDSEVRREDLATTPPPSGSGVPVHIHDTRYFTESEHINVSAGAADAGKPIKLDAAGHVDASMINDADIDVGAIIHSAAVETTPLDADETAILDSASSFALKRITWTTIKAFLKTYFDTLYELAGAIATHAALTVTHGATGAIVGTTNVQTLTNKTLTAPTIADFTNAQHDHLDADDGGLISAVYTDEQAQDAVGTILVDSSTIDFTYTDATPEITAIVIDGSITYAKMQDVSATDKVLGRSTAGAGDVEEIPLTAFGRSLIAAAAASNARTTLELVIGTDVQAQDAELAAIAGLTSAADRLAYFTGSGTAALATFTAFARTLIDDIDAAAMRTTLGLVIGTNVQAQDATLLSIAALGTAADRVAYTTGVDTWAETPLTSFGRSLIDDAAASNARTTLGLGTIAIEAETAYALLAGRASGQTLNGGTAANEDLTLEGTAHATKTTSYVLLQTTGGLVGIRVATPEEELHVGGDILTNNGGFYKSKTVAGSLIRIFGIGGDDIAYFGGIDAGVTEMRVRTGGSDRMVINATGLSIAGTALPQGKLHVHDGTGGWLNVSKTGVGGTKVVIIADGVGDVQGVLTCMYSLQNSDNTVTGGMFVLAKTASFAVTIGGTTWTFTVSGGGEFSVISTAGTDTAIIVMTINWR